MKRFIAHLLKGVGLASLLMAAANAAPDLQIVGASFPNPVEPGGTLVIETTVANTGSELAVGTDSGDGYMIDFVLSSDDHVPPGFTPFEENFGEDALLRGGRVSNTRDLAPGENANYAETTLLPADIPLGEHQICIVVDPGDEIAEADEGNNTFCQTLTVAWPQPDLMIIAASIPRTAAPGGSLAIEVTAYNMGNAEAMGTETSDDGYMIDLVLSSDDHVPPGFTPFEENFIEDVLLLGGRISNTHDLAPHSDRLYAETGVLPADTPPGDYQLCLVIDPGDGVVESDESNNTLCQTLTVSALEVPTAVERISWGRLKAIQ